MKGCLVILGVLVAVGAVFGGVFVWAAGRGDGDDVDLTRQATRVEITRYATAQIGQATNRRTVADVDYTYEVGSRRFSSSTRLPGSIGSQVDVCFDPDDPAEHTVRTNPEIACGSADLGSDGVRRAQEAS